VRDLAKLPKAHLHLHFTGSMRVETLRELAAQHQIRVPAALVDDDPLRVPADERGWFSELADSVAAKGPVDEWEVDGDRPDGDTRRTVSPKARPRA
jgi:hypothetical protein